MENQTSIIINGTRYDAVDAGAFTECEEKCDLAWGKFCAVCYEFLDSFYVFKKSDKKFEV